MSVIIPCHMSTNRHFSKGQMSDDIPSNLRKKLPYNGYAKSPAYTLSLLLYHFQFRVSETACVYKKTHTVAQRWLLWTRPTETTKGFFCQFQLVSKWRQCSDLTDITRKLKSMRLWSRVITRTLFLQTQGELGFLQGLFCHRHVRSCFTASRMQQTNNTSL